MTEWKRPKVIESKTTVITECGNLYLTLGYEEDRLIEVRATIGKNGICANVLLDTMAKLMSMYLQSPEPRYKIVEKFKKQFLPDTKGNSLKCDQGKTCIEDIAKNVVAELTKQIG